MGTLNLITAAKRKQAAALVKEGISISLSANANTVKEVDNPCPVEWAMLTATSAAALDQVSYPCIHGAGTTHLDSFAHIFFGGKMWNGYAVAGLVTKDGGAAKNSILTMKDGIVTRGILYDISSRECAFFLRILKPGRRRPESEQVRAMRCCCAGAGGRGARKWDHGRSTRARRA
jgi:hypothetical protein